MAGRKEETPHAGPEEKIRLNSPAANVTFLHKLAGFVGAVYLAFVEKTSFVYSFDHPKYLEYRRLRKSLIYGFWHNAQVFLAYEHRGEGINAIISRSKDGEYIAQVILRIGLNAVRGSSSRGGEQALRELCELLEAGKQVGFTPDGPRGPVQSVQGGVVMAAQRSGAPIIPMYYLPTRRVVFNSWDKFYVPLPFGSISIAHGEPLYLSPELPMDEAKEKVRRALNEAVAAAEEGLREIPSWGMSLLESLIGKLYSLLFFILAPLSMPFVMIKYGTRRTFRFLAERFDPGEIPQAHRRIWLHAASVGEWQALKPVMAQLESVKDVQFIITVSTPEARALVAKEKPQTLVRMLPIDLPWVLSKWISKVNSWATIIVETELWPNLINVLHKKRVPVFIINGRLSKRSVRRWKLFRPFIQRTLRQVSGVLARTELDGNHFCQLGASPRRVSVTGNTKYDNLPLADESTRAARRRQIFTDPEGVWIIGGSTWPGEEVTLLKLFEQKSETKLRLILAPRHKDRFVAVSKLLASVPASWSSWSKVKESHLWDTDILLVDTLGDLKSLYQYADIAFVGGSLTFRGGQNPLEPAAAGIPVLFGPSMENFHEEAAALKHIGAARQVRHEADLLSDIREISGDTNLARTMGTSARRFVEEKQGAALKTANALKEMLGL